MRKNTRRMGRPPAGHEYQADGDMVRISAYIERGLYLRVVSRAKGERRSLSGFVGNVLQERVAGDGQGAGAAAEA